MRIDVANPAGGVVVLRDTFAKGWCATVDGRPAAILPVDILSRGVVVPAGRHSIEMRYVPEGFTGGGIISGVTLLSIFAFPVLASVRPASRGGRFPRRAGAGAWLSF